MKDLKMHQPTHPGRITLPGGVQHRLRVGEDEGQFGGHSANDLAMAEGSICLLRYGDIPYSTSGLTETKDHTATITTVGGGVKFATQASPTTLDRVENVSLRNVTLALPTVGMIRGVASARMQTSSASAYGFAMGFVTAAAQGIVNTAPADGIYMVSASGTLVGRTVENSGTAHNSATLATVANATDLVLTIKIELTPTKAYGTWYVNGVATPFTAAQNTDLLNIAGEATPLSGYIGYAVTGTTQETGLVSWVRIEADRPGLAF